MTKIRTLAQLQNALDEDFSWRLKEIADLKSAVKRSRDLSERTLMRAGLALLYAHWEGFVRAASTHYLNFVSNQGKTCHELRACFAVLGVKRHLEELIQVRKSRISVAALEFIRASMNTRAKLQISGVIDTRSNLKADVFENIAHSIGIATASYESRFNLMDESLLARRNRIAHGEYLDIDVEGWRKLSDEVLLLMRQFKTDIENAASTNAFVGLAAGSESH